MRIQSSSDCGLESRYRGSVAGDWIPIITRTPSGGRSHLGSNISFSCYSLRMGNGDAAGSCGLDGSNTSFTRQGRRRRSFATRGHGGIAKIEISRSSNGPIPPCAGQTALHRQVVTSADQVDRTSTPKSTGFAHIDAHLDRTAATLRASGRISDSCASPIRPGRTVPPRADVGFPSDQGVSRVRTGRLEPDRRRHEE